jgi:hypothetical protein
MVLVALIIAAVLITGHAFTESEPRLVPSCGPVGTNKCDGDYYTYMPNRGLRRCRCCYPCLNDGYPSDNQDEDEPYMFVSSPTLSNCFSPSVITALGVLTGMDLCHGMSILLLYISLEQAHLMELLTSVHLLCPLACQPKRCRCLKHR